MFALLDALWLALSFSSHDSVVYSNLSWWIAGTAIFCMFLAGLVAGRQLGCPWPRRRQRERPYDVGPGPDRQSAWSSCRPSRSAISPIPSPSAAHVYSINYLSYWTAFWSLLIGLGAGLVWAA